MKHIIFIALLFCTFSAWAQYPTHPTKQELGRQTTGDGLTFRGSGAPAYTPTGKNNAWMFLDTLSGTLYAHMGGSWQVVSAGGGSEITDVSVSNDTLYITTTDSTFVAVFDDANTNFANSNLTFTGNRVHNLNGKNLIINDAGTYPTLYVFPSTDGIGMSATVNDYVSATTGFVEVKSAGQLPISATDTVTITAGRIRLNAADTRVQQVTKSNTLNRVMMIDSITERVYYRDVSSIAGGGGTVTGTGTTGTIPVWSSSTALGDSPLTVSSGNVTATGTGAFRLPNGTTAQRPGTPTAGMTRYNTTNGAMEYYGAAAWEVPVKGASATGLGTANRVFYADANGRAAADGSLHFASSILTVANSSAQTLGAYRGAYISGIMRATQGIWLGTGTGTSTAPWIFPYSTSVASPDSAGQNVSFYSYSAAINHAFAIVGGPVSATSGTGGVFYIGKQFSPSSGTGVYNILELMSGRSINQTGGANGITRGIWVNPTITAAADWRGIEITPNAGRGIYQTGTSATNNFAGATHIGAITTPARTLHVTGEARITDLTTDTPTQIVGADADGDLGSITVGSGLSLSSGTLSATGGTGTTNLAFSGASSPVTLTSDTGTDVIFAAGSGLALSQSGGTATYSRTYSLIHTTITGGSTFFGTTAERPDNDTPGSATTSTVGSDFSVSGSTIDYTGGSGALIRVQGSISFSVADDGDYYVSMYKEGTEIGATSMRVSCVAGNYYSISLPATTTSGSTNDTFDLRIATVSGNSTTTMHRYGFILERIY